MNPQDIQRLLTALQAKAMHATLKDFIERRNASRPDIEWKLKQGEK